MSLTKNPQPPTTIFFKCRLDDWLIRLSSWTAL